MTKLRSLETHFPHIGQAHAPPCVPWHTLARASRPIAGPIPREIRRRHGPCSHLAPMTQLRPWLSLFLLAAAIGCGSTSTSPTDSPDGGEAGTAPPTQFSCPNGRPNTTVDPAVCTAQKVSTFYNCPVSQPPSVCNVTFAYACGLPAGTGPFPGRQRRRPRRERRRREGTRGAVRLHHALPGGPGRVQRVTPPPTAAPWSRSSAVRPRAVPDVGTHARVPSPPNPTENPMGPRFSPRGLFGGVPQAQTRRPRQLQRRFVGARLRSPGPMTPS
jgi:hypothetical protein